MRNNPGPERARRLAEEVIPPNLSGLGRLLLPGNWTEGWASRFSGSLGLLVRLSLPAMVGMLVQSTYFFVDRAFVGKAMDLDAGAGIMIAFPYMIALQAASMLIGIGAAARVSIKLGEKKHEEAELILGNAATMLFIASAVLTVAGLVALPYVMNRLELTDSVREYASQYLHVIIFATGFQLVGYGLNSIIRSEGNTRTAMWTLLIGVFLNAILAYIFLFVFHWGMRGAAWATAISQGVSALWVLLYFVRGHSILRFHWQLLRLDGPTCGRILLFGLPMFVMMLFASIMLTALNSQAKQYGKLLGPDGGAMALAIWGAIFSLLQMANNPVYGVNQGTQPIIGFNYGAQRFDRVKQALLTGILFASTLTVAGFVAAMIFPEAILSLFINRDKVPPEEVEQMLHVGAHAMRICFLMSPLVGFQAVSASYFQVVGKPREATFLMLSRQVLLLIPMVLILPRFFGLDGVWMALPVSDFLSSLITGTCLFFELRHLDVRHQHATAAAENIDLTAKDTTSTKESENIGEPCS
jgi:putative MATE family efflux protein